ncbi:MAG: peptide deformylase [Desulfotignum sp.]
MSQPSAKVETIDEEIRELIRDMGETMSRESGVGLAAPQVGVNKRILVYNARAADPEDDGTEEKITALINPEITEASGSYLSENEGCLSVVDFRADVKRYETVRVRARDMDGRDLEFEARGLAAVIMQHEIDHLDGILFIDRISALKRAMYKKRILKQIKEARAS